jgi:fused signal recognition particle receptor
MAFNWFKKKKDMDSEGATPAPQPQQTPPVTPPTAPSELQPEPDRGGEVNSAADPAAEKAGGGFFKRLKQGLSKTRKILTTDIEDLFASGGGLDDDTLEELEELLITSDLGVETSLALMQTITRKAAKIGDAEQLKELLKTEILGFFGEFQVPAPKAVQPPRVVMVVGVNGVGKTTTIGKLAARCAADGQRVLIAAADTFRAAAIEQLDIWAQRASADIVKHKANADPAAVAFDGVEAALARGSDVLFVDTAGRLHTKVNLMEELKKIKRILGKRLPAAPHEVLLVLDATTGQNALSQAKMFNEALGVTSIALTKLDGTAKGGIVISICKSLNIPLTYIGVGEGIEDLQPFDPEQFVQALF